MCLSLLLLYFRTFNLHKNEQEAMRAHVQILIWHKQQPIFSMRMMMMAVSVPVHRAIDRKTVRIVKQSRQIFSLIELIYQRVRARTQYVSKSIK